MSDILEWLFIWVYEEVYIITDVLRNRYSQNASVVFLLVHLVNDIFDEDTEVFHSMVVDNVTHIRNQNRFFDSVLKIHQEPENIKRLLAKASLLRTWDKHLFQKHWDIVVIPALCAAGIKLIMSIYLHKKIKDIYQFEHDNVNIKIWNHRLIQVAWILSGKS